MSKGCLTLKMTKIRKLKKAKKYQYNINRKRLNKKRLPTIQSDSVHNAWNPRTSSRKNFKKLGLVFDVNADVKQMNRESHSQECLKAEETNSSLVVKDLEKNAEVITPEKNFRFSKDQVDYITYLMDKYGDDYKAMSRDRKNYLQQTWKQIRYKIMLFKSIPDHYKAYLKNKQV